VVLKNNENMVNEYPYLLKTFSVKSKNRNFPAGKRRKYLKTYGFCVYGL
jgi:hypothetical protein